MTNPYLNVTLRDATPADVPYIYKSWIESYRNAPSSKRMLDDYYTNQLERIREILSTCPVTVACLADDVDTICGFICHDKTSAGMTMIHYIYVKLLFRHDGIANMLFNSIDPTLPAVCSHQNTIFEKLRHKFNLITIRDYDTLLKYDNDPIVAYQAQLLKREQSK